MQSSFPIYALLHAVKFHQLLLGDPRETLISVTLMLRSLGSAKYPRAYQSLSEVAGTL